MTMTIPESFEQRVSRLRALMTEIGAGPFLADHGELMAWLTGYTVSETMYRAMLVGCDEAPWMVLSAEGIGTATRCWSRKTAANAPPGHRGACWSVKPRSAHDAA